MLINLQIISLILILISMEVIVEAVRISNKKIQTANITVLEKDLVSKELIARNFLIGIASMAYQYENRKTKCRQELQILLKDVDEQKLWTLKLLDAYGYPPKHFLWGNYFWFDSMDFCLDLNHPLNINLKYNHTGSILNVTSPIALELMMVYLNFSMPYYIDLKLPFENYIHLGLCLPKSCNSQQIQYYVEEYFQSGKFEMQRNLQLEVNTLDVKIPHISWKLFLRTGTILFIIILIIDLMLCLSAEMKYGNKIEEGKNSSIQREFNENLLLSTRWSRFLFCFCLSRNYRSFLSAEIPNRKRNYFTAMSGFRTIICLWITVFHVYYYSLYAMSNTAYIMAKLENFVLQPILQACFYVDVFFIMSSFLMVYNFLSNTKQNETILKNTYWKNFQLYSRLILQRFIRLTPVLIITILLSDIVYNILDMYSPFHLGPHTGIYCKNNWWQNLLYIQNLQDMNTICCSWTWYLACEMQYFAFFTGLLIIYIRHPVITKYIFTALTFSLMVFACFCQYTNGSSFQIDVIYSTLNELYVKPWVRIIPYLGGIIMGWMMYEMQLNKATEKTDELDNEQQYNQHKKLMADQFLGPNGKYKQYYYRTFLIFFAVIYLLTNFMSYWRTAPTWLVAIIMSFGKFVFALCIGAVIIICACGHGGLLNNLMSSMLFRFFNKFCYSIYMLAPIVVVATFGLRNEPTNFTYVGSGADFIAIIMTATVSAMLMVLLVEIPMQNLSKLLFRA